MQLDLSLNLDLSVFKTPALDFLDIPFLKAITEIFNLLICFLIIF